MNQPQTNGEMAASKRRSLHCLEATNFFLADVQTGLGPFIAAYLAASGWQAGQVGRVLTLAGLLTVLFQTPAGALIDRLHRKRLLLVAATIALAAGALLLAFTTKSWAVYAAQVMIGATGPFLGPTLAAITMGLVGVKLFDRQFGRNQGFNSAGNVASAGAIALISHLYGNRAIFFMAAALTVPTILSVAGIRDKDISAPLADGGFDRPEARKGFFAGLKLLLQDRVLLLFLACAFLFHLANAAMLPQLGELLAHGSVRAAAPFMSACIAVTQVVIMVSAAAVGRIANQHGRKFLLLVAFGVLPLRALLYTVLHQKGALIGVQVLDGVANSIFGVVSILVVADRTRGTGRFNLVQGALATAVGLGAAFSTTIGGMIMVRSGYRASFLTLGGVAAFAFLLLLFTVPETLPGAPADNTLPNLPAQGAEA